MKGAIALMLGRSLGSRVQLYRGELESRLLSCQVTCGRETYEMRRRTHIVRKSDQPQPLFPPSDTPDQDGVTARQSGFSTKQLRPHVYCGAQGKKKNIKVFLSLSHSFLSLLKAENQSAVRTHTRAQKYTQLISFPFPSSIQQPVII